MISYHIIFHYTNTITISTFVTCYICFRVYITWSMHMHPRLCYLIMKKYTSRSQHKHIPSYTITISTSVITVSTFVTRYTFTLLLFEVCVYVTSHERIYVTVITYSITYNHNFNIRHTLMLHTKQYSYKYASPSLEQDFFLF